MNAVTSPPVLAEFSYAIRGPQKLPRIGVIEATPVAGAAIATGQDWNAAVELAHERARQMRYDGIHGLPLSQAQGILEARDGTYSVVPLEGFHREKTGPLFVDGMFFDREALSLQIARRSAELVAVAGARQLVDLRDTGYGLVQPNRA